MQTIKKWISAAVVAAALTSVWSVNSLASPVHPRKVIFDNDAALDDTLALLLIGNHPAIDIQAITVSGTGEAHGSMGARNMASVAALMGKTHMPVAYGRATPLSNAGQLFPDFKRQHADKLLTGTKITLVDSNHVTDNAVALIHKIVSSSDDKITILATGPLTNIAEFLQQYPQLKKRIERIVIMGGAVNVPGNIDALLPGNANKVSEWNFYIDPKAAQVVLQSGVPITLVALDACNQVPLTNTFYDAVGAAKFPELQLAHHLLNIYVTELGAKAFKGEIFAWDELAAMVLVNPSIAQTENLLLTVDAGNGNVKQSAQGAKIDVVTKIMHPNAVLRDYISMVKSNHSFVERKYSQDAAEYRTHYFKRESGHA